MDSTRNFRVSPGHVKQFRCYWVLSMVFLKTEVLFATRNKGISKKEAVDECAALLEYG